MGKEKLLCLLQHIALTVLIIALLVIVGSCTVQVTGFREEFVLNMYNQDPDVAYEDSNMYNVLFGSALSDIVRHGVISSQLETDGHFDGRKVVDVTAFCYRETELPSHYVTAEYYLEDLLKWANYGFEWSTMQMTREQAQNFLAEKTTLNGIDSNSQYEDTSDADQEIGRYNVLVNRYKTVGNKNLEEYVSDWSLYSDLCKNVQSAAQDLSYNFEEYLLCGEHYNLLHSNVRYMIMNTVGEDTQIYSNLTDEHDYGSVKEYMIRGGTLEKLLGNEADRFIYYSPEEMTYRTNTNVTEDTVRQIIQEYDYAYPETVKLWISVDGTYPADDWFRQGAIGYKEYRPYLWQGVAAAVAAGILYLVILFYLTRVTGKGINEEGKPYIRLHAFDRVPTEGAILLACGAFVLAVFVLMVVTEVIRIDPTNILFIAKAVMSRQWFGVVVAGYIFIADFLAMLFFYSLVRRIRAKTLWRNSLLRMMIKCVVRFVWKVYDNGDIVLRTWVPFAAFLLVNFTLVLLGFVFLIDRVGFGFIITLIFLAAIDILVGNLIFWNAKEQRNIVEGIETIAGGQLDHQVATENLHGNNLILANSVNSIGKGIKEAVEISMKDERMKADLITNVSHDIKTPLTSIINYVDLIKREQIEDEKVRGYINVLDEKSQRLKQLTDDLVEASKISSGNISLNFEKINLTELMNQTIGEFSEKFELKKLTTVMNINAQNAVIEADSRRIWRVMENLFNNIFKYAMEGTRVYLTVESLPEKTGYIALTIKNISASPLNCDPQELTERFIRGDESRTTEGSGLGLSIARNLTEAQKGTFEIQLDGDLFKVILTFPLAEA